MLMKSVKCCLLLFFFSLAGCGFHLRGDVPLAPPLHNIYLQTNDPYGLITRTLKQSLELSGVHLAPSESAANITLTILREDMSQQLLSVGGTQQTRQYNLILTVTFQLTKAGKIIVLPQAITETRPVTIQANQILAGSNEVNDLYQRMRIAIVYDIMTRLSSNNVTMAVMKSS